MNTQRASQILDQALDETLPPHLDLTERIMNKAGTRFRYTGNQRLKFATSLALAFAVILFLSSIVYAIYQIFADPGLQSIQDSGLVTNVDATAQPMVMTQSAPSTNPQAIMVGQSQTVEGVTMTLDWLYLDNTQLFFGIHYSELPTDVNVDFPAVFINNEPLGKDQQKSKYLQATKTQAFYASFQVLGSEMNDKLSFLEISIPVTRLLNGANTSIATFVFSLPDVLPVPGQMPGFQWTRAVSVNGSEMQLHQVFQTPSATEVVICPSSPPNTDISVQQASLEWNGLEWQPSIIQPIGNVEDRCSRIHFDTRETNDGLMKLMVNSTWEFFIDPLNETEIPGIQLLEPTTIPDPRTELTINQVSLRLDWIFADARRIAFGYTISGLPEIPAPALLGGTVSVRDGAGTPFGGQGGGSSTLQYKDDHSGTITGTWSTILNEPLTVSEVKLNIDVTLDGSHGTDWNYVIGNITSPASLPDEVTNPIPEVLPSTLIGTYHFETTSPVYPLTTLYPGQVIEANGIKMELVQADLTPSASSYIVCYQKPSMEDWMVSIESSLLSGVEFTTIEGYALLSDTDYVMKQPVDLRFQTLAGEQLRCARIEFSLGHANQERTITLTIPALELASPENFPQEVLNAALTRLKEQGIEMTLITRQGVGGGGGGWEYTILPEGMSEEEAYQQLINTLGYRTPGPWVFSFTVNP